MATEFDKNRKEAFQTLIQLDLDIPFDFNAQDLKDWEWLQQFIPQAVIYSAGGMCPFQAEGLIGDYSFYYRERGGVASLRINHKDVDPAIRESLYSSCVKTEEFIGHFRWVETFINLVNSLEKSPFFYEFEAKDVEYLCGHSDEPGAYRIVDRPSVKYPVRAWGHSEAEAYKNAQEIRNELIFIGYTEEIQKKIFEEREVNPNPLNKDCRVFEKENPFKVNVPEEWKDSKGWIHFPKDGLIRREHGE